MKKILILFCLAMVTVAAKAQTPAKSTNPKYDPALAYELGADEYGMKSYVLAILKTGSNTSTDKAEIDSAFRGHMANMNRLVKEGYLVVAGPLKKNDKQYRGIFILNVTTVEEAAKLVNTDPAIKGKFLDVELYGWYGSAALPEHLKIHDKIEKKSF